MARHHKKTKKHSRRRMRGGGEWLKPWTWGTPVASAVAPVVDATIGTPAEQAKVVGLPPPSAPSSTPDALTGQAPVGGRRRTRKRRHTRR